MLRFRKCESLILLELVLGHLLTWWLQQRRELLFGYCLRITLHHFNYRLVLHLFLIFLFRRALGRHHELLQHGMLGTLSLWFSFPFTSWLALGLRWLITLRIAEIGWSTSQIVQYVILFFHVSTGHWHHYLVWIKTGTEFTAHPWYPPPRAFLGLASFALLAFGTPSLHWHLLFRRQQSILLRLVINLIIRRHL